MFALDWTLALSLPSSLIFLDGIDRQFVYTIMAADRMSSTHSLVQFIQHVHFLQQQTSLFFLSLGPSSAFSSLFPDIIKTREQYVVQRIVKSNVEVHCVSHDISAATQWDSLADASSCGLSTQMWPRMSHGPSAVHDGYSNSSASNENRDAQTRERGISAVFCSLALL